jgi:hypothetical protein
MVFIGRILPPKTRILKRNVVRSILTHQKEQKDRLKRKKSIDKEIGKFLKHLDQ